MNKAQFFELCDGAVYGTDVDGIHYRLCVLVGGSYRDLMKHVYLIGHFQHGTSISVETVNGQYTPEGSISATNRLIAKLPKYERWLEEWKALNPPRKNIHLCVCCDRPATWCDHRSKAYLRGVSKQNPAP